MLTTFSCIVHYFSWISMTCSQYVHDSLDCSQPIHNLFMTCYFCWLIFHSFFVTCPVLVHDLFMSCSWLFHIMIWSWIVPNFFMTCSQLVHDLSMTCSWPVHVHDWLFTFITSLTQPYLHYYIFNSSLQQIPWTTSFKLLCMNYLIWTLEHFPSALIEICHLNYLN